MATNSTIAVPASLVRSLDTNLYDIAGKPTLPAVASGDSVTLFTAPHAMRVTSAHLRVPATLGAGVTCKLQKNTGGTRSDITASTTAATAGVVASVNLPIDLASGDTIEVLVSGGASSAGAIEYDVIAQRA